MSSTTHNIVPGRFSKGLPVTTKVHFKSSTNSTNATSVKSSPGIVFNVIIHNTHTGGGSGAAIAFRLYNKTTAPVVGTDVPIIIIHVPSGNSKEINFTSGVTFTDGIAYSITGGDDLLDATVVDADGVQLYMGYV